MLNFEFYLLVNWLLVTDYWLLITGYWFLIIVQFPNLLKPLRKIAISE